MSFSTRLRPFHHAAPRPSERVFRIDCELSYEVSAPTDFVFLVHALEEPEQHISGESIAFHGKAPFHVFADPTQGHRFTRVRAEAGRFTLLYRALARKRPFARHLQAPEHPVPELPDHVLHNLTPTRYCESDHLGRNAKDVAFATLFGPARMLSMNPQIEAVGRLKL